MRNFFVTGIVLLFCSACVSTKNVPLDSTAFEKNKFIQITLSSREKPSFAATTPGKAAFGALGAAGMINAGNKIIEENEIEDPANFIGVQLAEMLVAKYGLAEATRSNVIVNGLKTKSVVEAYTGLGLLLDIQTINWSFVYFPTKWGKYRVIYTAKLRLINSDSGKLLAEGFCKRIPEYEEEAPTQDELLANKAAKLKNELSLAANSCIEQLKTSVLNL